MISTQNYGSNRIKFTHHGYIKPLISWCRLYCGVEFFVYLRVEFFASGDIYGVVVNFILIRYHSAPTSPVWTTLF